MHMVLTSQMKKKSGGMELGVKHHAHHMHSITKASNHLYAYNILKEATKNSRNKEDIIKNDFIKSDVIRNDVIRHDFDKNDTSDVTRNNVIKNDGIRNDVMTANRDEILCIKPVEIDSKQFITEAYSRHPTSPSLKSPSIDKSVVGSTSPLLRKPSPKSLTSSRNISPRSISPRNMSPENILPRKKTPDNASHDVSSLRESPPSSVREVINIDSRNIDTCTNSDFDYRKNIINGFKKAKRKKGSIDEILQQVEAKKRKEESKHSVLKTMNHFDDKVGEKQIPEIIPPSSNVTENDKDMIKSGRQSSPITSSTASSALSSPPTLLSPPKPKTEIYLKNESHYDVIPPSKEKLFFIQNPKYVRPIVPLLNNERPNYRNEIVDYRLQPNKKNSAFHQVRKEYKFVPYTRENQPHVYYPSITTPSPKISSTRDMNNNDPSHITSSEQSKNDNSIKNENFTRKKKKLPPNERYSNLTSSQLQRRLVANARERSRVHALSNAFDTLRSAIPSYSPEQKISKLTILRVAINYINALQEILSSDPMHIYDNRAFVGHVNECSCVLQTEYGRSKVRLAID